MVKRIMAVAAALLLLCTGAGAGAETEMNWDQSTPALQVLKAYTENVNRLLTESGEKPINRLVECYPQIATLWITDEDDAELPEGVQISVALYYDTLNSLELWVNNADRFPRIAAAFIRALYGDSLSAEDAIHIPTERARRAKQNPGDSFEEPVEEMNGTVPRFYYAYHPDLYHDGENWMRMTVIFPLAGTWEGEGMILGTEKGPGQAAPDDADPNYEGFFSTDDYTHMEVFASPTPEPDSAAAEYDFR